MKILLISENINYLDRKHPDFVSLLEFAEYLEQLHVVILNPKKSGTNDQFINISDRLFIYPINYINPLAKKKLFFDIVESNIKWTKKLLADLILAENMSDTSYFAYELSQAEKVPFIVNIKKNFQVDEKPDEDSLNLDYKIIINGAGGIAVASEKMKNQIVSIDKSFEQKVFYIEDYINFTSIDKKEVKEDIYKRYPQAGLIVLIEVGTPDTDYYEQIFKGVKQLNDNHFKTSVVLLGKNKYIERIWKLGLDILKERVFLEQNNDNFYDYLKKAKLFIIHPDSSELNKKIMISILSGCPVLTENVGLAKNYIDEGYTGYIYESSEKSLESVVVRVIMDVFRDPNIRDKILLSYRNKIINRMTTNKDEFYKKYIANLQEKATFVNLNQTFYEL
jgi:hypothetical protein